MAELLNTVISSLHQSDVSIHNELKSIPNFILNGDKNLSSNVELWGEDAGTEGSLAYLNAMINDLNTSIMLNGPDGSLNIIDIIRIISEGTDEEVAAYGLEHSCKTYALLLSAIMEDARDPINVGPCTEIGRMNSSTEVQLTWKDPDDVVMNGTILATWTKTELWRCEGNVPSSIIPNAPSATLIATTDREGLFNVKNSFYKNSCIDNTVEANKTYSYKLFSYCKAGTYNNMEANEFPDVTTYTWGMLHYLSQAGTLPQFLPISSIVMFNHDDYGVVPVRFVSYDEVQATNTALHPHAAVFQTVDCICESQFDSPETQYEFTQDTVVNGSKTYYSKEGNTYTAEELTPR